MTMWRLDGKKIAVVQPTTIKQENFLEKNVEDWIAENPSLLGEPLLIIVRQVAIPDVKDKVDLLALDPHGHVVIIEIKRGILNAPVDIQALRYASYLAKWSKEDIELYAKKLRRGLSETYDLEEDFMEFRDGATEESAEAEVEINKGQRIIIVGTSVRDKLGSTALWLRDRGIDIKIIQLEAYKDGKYLYIRPSVIVPLPVQPFSSTGMPADGGREHWISDGKKWHLSNRCSEKTRVIMETLDELVTQNTDAEGPIWAQKFYVAYRIEGKNWLTVETRKNQLGLRFRVQPKLFKILALSKKLNLKKFDSEKSLSEKFALPSSVSIKHRYNSDSICITIKDEKVLKRKVFISFLKEAFDAAASEE